MTRRKIRSLCIAATIAAMGAVYYFTDPGKTAWMPKCIYRQLTGFDCPGCGSQRMIHALLRGDLSAAWHYNAFLLCMIPWLLTLGWLEIFPDKNPRLRKAMYSPWAIAAVCILIVVWTIVRNIL